ncbi:MAG: DUF4838 domain-containing protein [Kiritimatiellae bacterium]|nr:DUF4838 domain-containing protein [Kiritimatiellia bacterium]
MEKPAFPNLIPALGGRTNQTMKKTFASLFATSLVAASLLAAEPPPFVLAEGGLAKAVIVLPADPLPGVKYAANELADFLGRISGTHFMVADAPVKGYKTILVGTPYKPEHPEEICIRVKDEETLEVTGDRSRGTLYAAYDLLESLGVVFCTRDFDYVPQTNRLEIAGDYAKVDWPFMYAMRRSWSDTSWKFRMAQKLRFHSTLESATKAGCPDLAEDYPHSYNHAVTVRWVDRRKFGKEHPEWYAWVRATNKRNRSWVCISNEEMWAQLLKEIGEYLEKHPDTRELSVAIGDCAHYCDCDACMAKVRQYLDPDGSEVPSVQCYLLANRIGKAFGKKYPDVRFNMLPYGGRQPANKDLKLEPNIGGVSAELWRNHCLPADCNERSGASLGQFCRNVTNPANGTYVWEYLANFRDWMIPFPNVYIMAQSARYYKRLDVRGVTTQYQFSGLGDLSEMKLWLHAKLLWNPDADERALVRKYIRANYGPAAKYVQEYVDIVEHARLRQRWTWYGCYVADTAHFLTDEDCVKIYRALMNAETAVKKSPAYVASVRRAQIPAIGLAIWRYQDMIEPARRMKVALPSLEALYNEWHSILDDSASARYSKWLSEHGANYGKRITQMFDVDIQPTNRVPPKAVLRIAAKEMTGGSRMTRERDPDGTEFCQLKVALKGEPENIWMNPGFAEIGYTCKLEDTGEWYVFATVRLGTTVDGDPSSAYMGLYQKWYPNGFRCDGNMEVANQAIVGHLADAGQWRTVCLGKRRLALDSRVWIMPGMLHPVDYIDVRDFFFVHPTLIEKGVAAR